MRILCRTYFDCSPTGVTGTYKPSHVPFMDQTGKDIKNMHDWNIARNQQRNLETVMQIVGLRSQPNNVKHIDSIDGVWSFSFEVETPGVFSSNGENNNIDSLLMDCEGVPMIVGLNEYKTNITKLSVQDPMQNIWFELINTSLHSDQ